jgi:hypothetical protein
MGGTKDGNGNADHVRKNNKIRFPPKGEGCCFDYDTTGNGCSGVNAEARVYGISTRQ